MIANERTLGFGANINRGVAATSAPFVVVSNPTSRSRPARSPRCASSPTPTRAAGSSARSSATPTAAGSRRAAASRRSRGTIVRRTPLRRCSTRSSGSVDHYLLDERPTEPAQSDWLLGAFLLLRREMLDELGGLDEGYRLYGEDIDLAYRARKAGWERWYVPDAS